MSDCKKKEEKQVKEKQARKRLAEATHRTLQELQGALEKTGRTEETARLRSELDGKGDAAIMEALMDEDSPLCRAIPVEVLNRTGQGRRYLDLLTVLQPNLKEREPSPQSPKAAQDGKTEEPMEVSSLDVVPLDVVPLDVVPLEVVSKGPASDPLSALPELLPGADSGELGDLVREILASGDLGRMGGDAPRMEDLTSMFGTVSEIISKKAAAGTLDLTALQEQAQNMTGRLYADHPELRAMLSQPNIASMMMGGASFGP
jgi:hypothetical protein